MTDETPAAPGIETVPAGDNDLSAHSAARLLSQYRQKREEQPAAKAEAPTPPPAAPETPPPEESAAPAEEATGTEATEETVEPAELPPVEAPRSWTKEQKAQFATFPREAQEIIAAREQDRETHLRRGQNDLAEQRKAFDAQRQQVEQARQQYENALPQLLQALHQQQMGEFSDIRTMADVENLARTDWPRYALWDAQQKKIAAVSQEVNAAQARQVQEKTAQFTKFAADQDAEFVRQHPEFNDQEKARDAAEKVIKVLLEDGYTRDEITSLWNSDYDFRSARSQSRLLAYAKSKEALKDLPKKVAKPVPPVQRPGVSSPKNSAEEARIKNLETQLNKSGSVKDALALLSARRAARK